MKEKKIIVKMLGNYRMYEAGQEISVGEDEARQLLALGYAVKIEEAPMEKAEE